MESHQHQGLKQGGYVSAAHNWIIFDTMTQILNSGVNSWYISPKHALAMSRHIVVSHFGHLASLVWAKLILGRFRDAILPDFSRFLLLCLLRILASKRGKL